VYVRVWEYEVAADHVDGFVAAYGAKGDWALLFRAGRGFLGTELYRGTGDATRFVTVDRWRDQGAWRDFLEEYRASYDRLDTALTHLTTAQGCLLEGAV